MQIFQEVARQLSYTRAAEILNLTQPATFAQVRQLEDHLGHKLIERLGGEIISCAFVIDLPDLGGRKVLEDLGMDVHALCAFEGL